jgi:phospholipid/cholesterol/gamma-HCH transport system permease protein
MSAPTASLPAHEPRLAPPDPLVVEDDADRAPEGALETTGAIVSLAWRTLGYTRYTIAHYAPEIVRQAGILVTGSLGIIVLICSFAGGTCGLEMTVVGRQFDVPTLVPDIDVLCAAREITPFVFGYILAAKVGCGIVAELGAMRVREEIDALEVVGVRSVSYLMTTRVLAALLVLPSAFILAQACAVLVSYLVSVVRFGDISSGTFVYQFSAFLFVGDIPRLLAKGMSMAVLVLAVSFYFGYTVRGGPVEVGKATARSMAVNIVGVTLINVSLSLAFWGQGIPSPIA